MKKAILSIAALILAVSSVRAVPLTWVFNGTTSASSQYNGMGIGGLSFEIRIFLDTNLVADPPMNLADIFFQGPHQGQVEIATLGVLPLNPFNNVQYFAPGGMVTGVQFNQPAFSDIMFDTVISTDFLHLTPIPLTTPSASNNTLQSGLFGPNGLFFSGVVSTFEAVLGPVPTPEAGATALLLSFALIALAFLQWRLHRAR
jgi:hypothetical protein